MEGETSKKRVSEFTNRMKVKTKDLSHDKVENEENYILFNAMKRAEYISSGMFSSKELEWVSQVWRKAQVVAFSEAVGFLEDAAAEGDLVLRERLAEVSPTKTDVSHSSFKPVTTNVVLERVNSMSDETSSSFGQAQYTEAPIEAFSKLLRRASVAAVATSLRRTERNRRKLLAFRFNLLRRRLTTNPLKRSPLLARHLERISASLKQPSKCLGVEGVRLSTNRRYFQLIGRTTTTTSVSSLVSECGVFMSTLFFTVDLEASFAKVQRSPTVDFLRQHLGDEASNIDPEVVSIEKRPQLPNNDISKLAFLWTALPAREVLEVAAALGHSMTLIELRNLLEESDTSLFRELRADCGEIVSRTKDFVLETISSERNFIKMSYSLFRDAQRKARFEPPHPDGEKRYRNVSPEDFERVKASSLRAFRENRPEVTRTDLFAMTLSELLNVPVTFAQFLQIVQLRKEAARYKLVTDLNAAKESVTKDEEDEEGHVFHKNENKISPADSVDGASSLGDSLELFARIELVSLETLNSEDLPPTEIGTLRSSNESSNELENGTRLTTRRSAAKKEANLEESEDSNDSLLDSKSMLSDDIDQRFPNGPDVHRAAARAENIRHLKDFWDFEDRHLLGFQGQDEERSFSNELTEVTKKFFVPQCVHAQESAPERLVVETALEEQLSSSTHQHSFTSQREVSGCRSSGVVTAPPSPTGDRPKGELLRRNSSPMSFPLTIHGNLTSSGALKSEGSVAQVGTWESPISYNLRFSQGTKGRGDSVITAAYNSPNAPKREAVGSPLDTSLNIDDYTLTVVARAKLKRGKDAVFQTRKKNDQERQRKVLIIARQLLELTLGEGESIDINGVTLKGETPSIFSILLAASKASGCRQRNRLASLSDSDGQSQHRATKASRRRDIENESLRRNPRRPLLHHSGTKRSLLSSGSVTTDENANNFPSDALPVVCWQIAMTAFAFAVWVVVLHTIPTGLEASHFGKATLRDVDEEYAVAVEHWMMKMLPFDMVASVVFLVDTMVSCRVNCKADRGSFINKAYLHKYLPMDILSIFPFYLILLLASNTGENFSVNVAVAFYHLRLWRLIKFILNYFQESGRVQPNRLYVVTLHYGVFFMKAFVVFAGFCTLAATIHFILVHELEFPGASTSELHLPNATRNETDMSDQGGKGSVTSVMSYKEFYGSFNTYVNSLFVVVYAVTGVGYGTYAPHSETVRMYLAALCIACQGFAAFVVGTIAIIILNLDTESKRRHDVMSAANIAIHCSLPPSLAQDMLYIYHQDTDDNLGDQFRSLAANLPPQIQTNILLFNKMNLIRGASRLFTSHPTSFLIAIAHELESMIFKPNDAVLWVRERTSTMYFVSMGVLQMYNWRGRLVFTRRRGSCFNEVAVVLPREFETPYTARSLNYAELHALTSDALAKVLLRFPKSKRQMDRWVARLREEGEMAQNRMLSDIIQTRALHASLTEKLWEKRGGMPESADDAYNQGTHSATNDQLAQSPPQPAPVARESDPSFANETFMRQGQLRLAMSNVGRNITEVYTSHTLAAGCDNADQEMLYHQQLGVQTALDQCAQDITLIEDLVAKLARLRKANNERQRLREPPTNSLEWSDFAPVPTMDNKDLSFNPTSTWVTPDTVGPHSQDDAFNNSNDGGDSPSSGAPSARVVSATSNLGIRQLETTSVEAFSEADDSVGAPEASLTHTPSTTEVLANRMQRNHTRARETGRGRQLFTSGKDDVVQDEENVGGELASSGQ